jgi:hypothetical protein
MAVQRDEHIDPESSRTLRLFRRWVPMTDAYHGQKFLIRRNGVLLATPLLAVLALVEITDVIFAVDSIPAIFAVTDEPFLVFTANAFAILGLRAMYFLLADLIHRFVYLKLGLALVLVWVGIKMALKVDLFYIPTTLSLAVIVTILTVSVVASQSRQPRVQAARRWAFEAPRRSRVANPGEMAETGPAVGPASTRLARPHVVSSPIARRPGAGRGGGAAGPIVTAAGRPRWAGRERATARPTGVRPPAPRLRRIRWSGAPRHPCAPRSAPHRGRRRHGFVRVPLGVGRVACRRTSTSQSASAFGQGRPSSCAGRNRASGTRAGCRSTPALLAEVLGQRPVEPGQLPLPAVGARSTETPRRSSGLGTAVFTQPLGLHAVPVASWVTAPWSTANRSAICGRCGLRCRLATNASHVRGPLDRDAELVEATASWKSGTVAVYEQRITAPARQPSSGAARHDTSIGSY